MPKLTVGLISLSLMYGTCAFAQQTTSVVNSNFPPAGYLQVPPHFQPRPTDAAHIVKTAPPPIPSYAQPAIPEEGYLWMPPYWSRIDDGYAFHAGYWDETVGFYGGINYGYGYTGDGYQGGHWDNGTFFYNRAANNLGSLNIDHLYDRTIVESDPSMRISFNGGSGGTKALPTPQQESLARDRH